MKRTVARLETRGSNDANLEDLTVGREYFPKTTK